MAVSLQAPPTNLRATPRVTLYLTL